MQSNDNTDGVSLNEKFKFIDDLSILETINLLTVGITSYNIKCHVPSDIPVQNVNIPAKSLVTQERIHKISQWTTKQKMLLNHNKSNIMILNPSKILNLAQG